MFLGSLAECSSASCLNFYGKEVDSEKVGIGVGDLVVEKGRGTAMEKRI